MGACCSIDIKVGRSIQVEREFEEDVDDCIAGDFPNRVRLRGSSRQTSMFTQQGRKGVNQDAMTVWEDFMGEKDMLFCGVFDGHGPYGHKVARYVRDSLPSKLYTTSKISQHIGGNHTDDVACRDTSDDHGESDTKDSNNRFFSSWETSLINSFKEIDQELSLDTSVDSFCSGTTAVTIIKKGEHLIISNLGDSRAVLCSRNDSNELTPIQLTVDLKPNIPSEAERIKNCRGRVFAMCEEPDVFRVWMPEEDCPGLAMARAFGDFCLKDYGLISIPEVSHRKITDQDEFVVLATDGIWDVLTNTEVINIVVSARKRSMAAKLLVHRAVQTWRCKYPTSKIDDCAVVCLFLKTQPSLIKSISDVSRCNGNNPHDVVSFSSRSFRSKIDADEEWSNLDGVSRANTLVKIPR